MYSRVPEDGFLTGLAKTTAAYLVDGVVDASAIAQKTGVEALLGKAGLDWLVKGTCNAGDVRVRFEERKLPEALSALGEVTSFKKLVAHDYTRSGGAAKLFVRSGRYATPKEFLAAEAGWGVCGRSRR